MLKNLTNTSTLREEMERAESQSEEAQRQQLEEQAKQLHAQMSTAQSEESVALRHQLQQTNLRLRRLESEWNVAQTIIRSYTKSVCLIHLVVEFRDQGTGNLLRFASVNAQGEPQTDSKGNPVVSTKGSRPEVRMDVFGTGSWFRAGACSPTATWSSRGGKTKSWRPSFNRA